MDPSRIGEMSCNPAIGGLAKGQIVREIDELGGIIGLAADASGIMFRMLNMSRGAAVRGPRCQSDKHAYAAHAQLLLAACDVTVIAATVDDLLVEDGQIRDGDHGRRVVQPQRAILGLESTKIERLGLVIAFQREIQQSQVGDADQGGWVVQPQRARAGLHSAKTEGLGIIMAALGLLEAGETAHGLKCG